MVYVPGFSPALFSEYWGGPMPVEFPYGIQPSAPPIMTSAPVAPTVAPTAPPIMSQPLPPVPAPTTYAPYIPTATPRLREGSYTPQDMLNAGYLDERSIEEPDESFRRADPSFSRLISDSNTYYTDPDTGFFYNDDASRVGSYFTTNRGGAATANGTSGFAEFNPNATYRLVNVADGNSVVYEGVGREGLIGVQGAAQQFAQTQGDQGDWRVEQMDPSSGQWSTVARDTRPSNLVGQLADIGLPVLGAVLAPFTFGTSAALGAALGSVGSSVLQGRSITDTLLRAGLSGLGTYAGGQLIGPTLGAGTASGVGGSLGGALAAAGPAASAALNSVLPNIVVQGAVGSGLGSLAGSAVGAGLGSAAGALSGFGGGGTTTQGNPITVTGSTATNPYVPTPGIPLPTGGGTLPTGAPVTETIGNPIEVVEQRPVQEQFDAAFPVPPTGGLVYDGAGNLSEIVSEQPRPTQQETPTLPVAPAPEGNITVTGERPGQFDFPEELAAIPPLATIPTTAGGTVGGLQPPAQPTGDGMSLDDIIRYLRAGSLGVGLLGSLFGGGGSQTNNRIPAGFGSGSLNPVFGGGLPAPTIPGAAGNFAPRQTNQDWYRYGYGPGQSFFNYVPQSQPNTSTAYTGYAEGGLTMGDDTPRDAYAVQGAGTGRSDEIPALLSDGEYVIDAETVALLGDGSTKAGADRLDQFRVNVRKHKGQQLAKGQFSPDAKPLERYMHGGLS